MKMFPIKAVGVRGPLYLNMKGRAHPSPFPALSFPDSNKVSFTTGSAELPVFKWTSLGSNSQPSGHPLHYDKVPVPLASPPWCLSIHWHLNALIIYGTVTPLYKMLFVPS